MKVYEVLEDCSISYTENGENHGGFCLYRGDFFFISEDDVWVKDSIVGGMDKYTKYNKLVKIYHNKLTHIINMTYEWTWVDNINVCNPYIKFYTKYNVFNFTPDKIVNDWENMCQFNHITDKSPIIKDVSLVWNRDEKLKLLLKD